MSVLRTTSRTAPGHTLPKMLTVESYCLVLP